MEIPELLRCAHCGSQVEIRLEIRDDEDKYPRPHWHALIECNCGIRLGWDVVSKQLPDNYDYKDQTPIEQDKLNNFCSVWNTRTLGY